jgi:hypothetical protein
MASGLVTKGERKGKGSYSSYKFVGLTIATIYTYSYFKEEELQSHRN